MGNAAASRALSGESGKWKLENKKWNGSWIFKVEKLKKKEFNAESGEYTEDAEKRRKKLKGKKEKRNQKGAARENKGGREETKYARCEGMVWILARAAEAVFFICGRKVLVGKKYLSAGRTQFCAGAGTEAAEEYAAKKERTRRRNSSGSKP
jgi:hypothetical protein